MSNWSSAEEERQALGFVDATLEIVGPWLERIGIELATVDEDAVRFASPAVHVDIIREPRSREIYLTFGRRQVSGERIEIASAIRVSDPAAADAYRDYAATSAEAVRSGLERLVELMDTYCRLAFRGDPAFFDAMAQLSASQVPWWVQDQRREQIEKAASQAMDAQDWQKLIALYEGVEHPLNNLERKRVEIARRHLAARRAGEDQPQR